MTIEKHHFIAVAEDGEKDIVGPTTYDNNISKRPNTHSIKNGHANNSPSITNRPKTVQPLYESSTPTKTTSEKPQNVILAAHPQDNEIAGSVNIR